MDVGSDPPAGATGAPEPIEGRGPIGQILSGLGWNTGGQVVNVAISLGLTPFLLERLGVDRYGLFSLLSSFRGFLSNLDGGLGPAAMRFFAIKAGAGDRRGTSSLLLTMLCLLTVVTGAMALVAWILAPELVTLIHTSPTLRHSAVHLLRLFLPLGVVAALQQAVTRIISAEHRWGYLGAMGLVAGLVYAGLAALLVEQGYGLLGLFWASLGAQAVLLVGSVLGARRQLVLSAFRLMPRAEVRELLRYSRRVQIAAVASSFNYEIDSLLVALLFPVRFVAYYSIGTNFSNQLIALPTNAITPIGVALSRTFGRSTLKETVDEFTRLQRLWVRSVAAFPLIGAATAYFAIDRWLGHADHLAGVVAAILLIGQTTSLLGLVMDNFGKSVNRPDLESRYLGVGVAVNLAVTIPLALTIGMLGVPAGTAIGMVISSAYFLHIARRELSPDLRSFVADIPKVALGLSVCVTLLLELPAFAIAPTGVLGLLVCAVPAGVGLGVYGLASTVRRARPVIPSQ